MTSITLRRPPGSHVPAPANAGTMTVSLGGWLSALSFAVVVLLASDDLWASLLALAAVNACAFFVFQEWVDRPRH